MEDGSLENTSSLSGSGTNKWLKSGSVTLNTGETYFGSKYVTLQGSDATARLNHVVPVNLSAGSTFILSGWAKANADPASVPEVDKDQPAADQPYFGLIARVYYANGESEPFYFSGDPYYGDWQYIQGIIVPTETYQNQAIVQVTVVAAYDYNINSALFDNISLRLEPAQTYSYNDEGKLEAATQTDTGEETATYAENGIDLTEYTAANGVKYSYTYNDKHDILTSTCDGVTNTYTYDTSGNATSSKMTATGSSKYMESTATMTADRNHTASVTDVNGNTASYTYDQYTGQQLTSTSDGITIHNGYNAQNGRLNQTYQSGVAALLYTYANGSLAALTRKTYNSDGTNPVWQRYGFTTNAWGQSTALTVAKSTDGSAYSAEKELAAYTYEPNGGNLTTMTYANGDSISYTYDKFDRLTEMLYNDTGNTVKYVYNAEGSLSQLHYTADGATTVYSFEYDSLGRLIRSSERNGDSFVQRTEHIYDAYNRLSTQTWVLGTTEYTESYTYDDGIEADPANNVEADPGDGSLKSMTTATGDTLHFNYDTLKRLQSTALKSGGDTLLETRYAYKHLTTDQTTAQVEFHKVLSYNGSVLTGGKYTYDARGNIIQISQSVSPYNPLVIYTYDNQNQLLSETYYDGNGNEDTNITDVYTYTYDTAGNILTEALNGTATKTYTYGDAQWADKLTKIKVGSTTRTISYDASGNPTNWYNGTAFTNLTWQQGRQLVSLKKGTATYTYAYDADGIRTEKTIAGVKHTYITQNGKVVRETIGTGSTAKVLDFIYDNQGRPQALRYSTNGGGSFTTYYYVLNLQGDVIKLVKVYPGIATDVAAEYSYDAWGNVLSATGTMASINPLRYRGYYYDNETGFYYLQSRYYDPAIHRFINSDTLASTGQGFIGTNMFGYCGNNPVSRSDIAGKAWVHNEEIYFREIKWLGESISYTAYYSGTVIESGKNIMFTTSAGSDELSFTFCTNYDYGINVGAVISFSAQDLLAVSGVISGEIDSCEVSYQMGLKKDIITISDSYVVRHGELTIEISIGSEALARIRNRLIAKGFSVIGAQVASATKRALRFMGGPGGGTSSSNPYSPNGGISMTLGGSVFVWTQQTK